MGPASETIGGVVSRPGTGDQIKGLRDRPSKRPTLKVFVSLIRGSAPLHVWDSLDLRRSVKPLVGLSGRGPLASWTRHWIRILAPTTDFSSKERLFWPRRRTILPRDLASIPACLERRWSL